MARPHSRSDEIGSEERTFGELSEGNVPNWPETLAGSFYQFGNGFLSDPVIMQPTPSPSQGCQYPMPSSLGAEATQSAGTWSGHEPFGYIPQNFDYPAPGSNFNPEIAGETEFGHSAPEISSFEEDAAGDEGSTATDLFLKEETVKLEEVPGRGSKAEPRKGKGKSVSRTPSATAMNQASKVTKSSKWRYISRARQIAKSKDMKRSKSCVRCQQLHEPCNGGTPCSRCEDLTGLAKTWKMSCAYTSLIQISVYRYASQSFPDGPRKLEKNDWIKLRTPTVVSLYHTGVTGAQVDPAARPQLKISVRQFKPKSADPRRKQWNGGKGSVELPPFAIPHGRLQQASERLIAMVKEHADLLLSELSHAQSDYMKTILDEAIGCRKDYNMIDNVLKLAVITQLASKSFNITGEETLGIDVVRDETSPYYQRRPIPPFADGQIDNICMNQMETLQKTVLSSLKALVMGKERRRHWYQIFLTCSILLMNLEYLVQKQEHQMERYCKNNPIQSLPFASLGMMEEWTGSAKTIICHFRGVCSGHTLPNVDLDTLPSDIVEVNTRTRNLLRKVQCHMASARERALTRYDVVPKKVLSWVVELVAPEGP